MIWVVCFTASILILLAAVIFAVVSAGKRKRGKGLTPFKLVFGGVFLAAFVCYLPIYYDSLKDASLRIIKTVLSALYSAFEMFVLNADISMVSNCANEMSPGLSAAYSTYFSFIVVLAPILTFGFLASFFKDASAYGKYILHYFREVYIFSALSDRSVSLGSDIRNNHRHAVIVYTDVFETSGEAFDELAERAREIGAICLKKDILTINFGRHYKKAPMYFYTIGNDETENINQSVKLIARYKNRENTRLFVFSTQIESELLLTQAEKGSMKVRRINEVRSLVDRILYERGSDLFTKAKQTDHGVKKISAVIAGLGQYGTEMLKALAWYCQMDGYQIEIDAFDKDEKAEERLTALAPELMSEKHNGVSAQGEAEYLIRIHSGIDISTGSFSDEIAKLTDATYVFVSLGSDEMNIRTAVSLRMMFERIGIKPTIEAIVYDSDKKNALMGIKNYRGQAYDIDFIGDTGTSYSEAVIMDSELEADALRLHLKWGTEEEFWQYEYNYNSSVASTIHRRARIACNIPGSAKNEEELTEEERDAIEKLEHRRWNAYMRSEGYIYSGSRDKSSRNDLAKMHHDLVDFSSLNEEEKRKDSKVGTI